MFNINLQNERNQTQIQLDKANEKIQSLQEDQNKLEQLISNFKTTLDEKAQRVLLKNSKISDPEQAKNQTIRDLIEIIKVDAANINAAKPYRIRK